MKELSVTELKTMLDNNEDFQLVDVREQNEKAIADIGGELIPLGSIPTSLDLFNKDKKIVVYCRSGGRSGQAVNYLANKLNLTEVYNVKGGILAWADEVDPSVTKY